MKFGNSYIHRIQEYPIYPKAKTENSLNNIPIYVPK
jgi:hypothetical protein